ncbi:MAG TPA: hypothetical protein VMT17_02250 [Anaeromyxobacteraceae bacterium]|nr:hypothetical protein [Anaeromyxobacteraceae bacterium]
MKEPVAGSLVKHRTLGQGKVVAVEATALHVFFAASESRYAAKLRWPAAEVFLSQAGLESDPWLEGLTSFTLDSAVGRYALAVNFVSHEEAIRSYLAENPTGFGATGTGAPRRSRAARWRAACHAWTSALGNNQAEKLLRDGDYRELARRALRVAACAAPIPGMIGTDVLEEAFEAGDKVHHYFDALAGYLSVPSPARARFERLCAASSVLGIPSDDAWTMVTFFPFAAVPGRHMVFVPHSAAAAANRLGCALQHQAAPNWATYVRLRDLSWRLLEKLAPSGARDLVDVECFLHATGARRPAVSPSRARKSGPENGKKVGPSVRPKPRRKR